MGKHSNHTNFAPKGIFEDCHSMNHQTLMGVAEAIKDYTEKGFICFIPLPDAPLPFLKPSMGEPDLVFNGDNVDTVTDTLRDLQGNLIDSTGKLIKKE